MDQNWSPGVAIKHRSGAPDFRIESPLERAETRCILAVVTTEIPNRSKRRKTDGSDPYAVRREEILRLSPRDRLAAIEADLRSIKRKATAEVTFHRKKLLRMHDDARLAAQLVTPAQLQKENSPFAEVDFSKAVIVWKRRARVSL